MRAGTDPGVGSPPTQHSTTAAGDQCQTGAPYSRPPVRDGRADPEPGANRDADEVMCARVDLTDAMQSAYERRRELGINPRNGRPIFKTVSYTVYVVLSDGIRIHTDTIAAGSGRTHSGVSWVWSGDDSHFEWVDGGKTYTFEIDVKFTCSNGPDGGSAMDCRSPNGDSGTPHLHRERVQVSAGQPVKPESAPADPPAAEQQPYVPPPPADADPDPVTPPGPEPSPNPPADDPTPDAEPDDPRQPEEHQPPTVPESPPQTQQADPPPGETPFERRVREYREAEPERQARGGTWENCVAGGHDIGGCNVHFGDPCHNPSGWLAIEQACNDW
ncbi:hypothetical protein [Candidatus Poriferisodalis sp.]|uniref:hypothetical protein n=1 Tax=Candidatus Poriferisodalis sp. TaxID=3101277 RepID=UPI003B0116D1